MSDRAREYAAEGLTRPGRVVDVAALEPLHALIFQLTSHRLPDAVHERPLPERLRAPLEGASAEDFSRLMNTVNASKELHDFVRLPAVAEGFREVLGVAEVEPFPIIRFRAQFPGLARSTYDWHQDEGTWYATRSKGLAGRLPPTLWLSVNGAEASNSIELLPGSHRRGLHDHRVVDGQGFFRAAVEVPEESPTRRVTCAAGEGFFFHPLLLHRSVVSRAGPPRYSIDVRYAPRERARERARERYAVGLRFRLKRAFAR